jgi:hypothetical protein
VWLAVAGTVAGIAGALLLSRLMAKLLYGVQPTDPATFGAVAVGLGVVAMLACYVPARRAMHIDPMAALRYRVIACECLSPLSRNAIGPGRILREKWGALRLALDLDSPSEARRAQASVCTQSHHRIDLRSSSCGEISSQQRDPGE